MSGSEPIFGGVGIPWYRRDDYPSILKVMADSHLLPRTFDEWEKLAEQAIRQFATQAGVYRVYIDPQQFVAWCAIRGLNVDAEARMKFVSDMTNWDTGDKH